ncbi:hypothetical protein BCR44DRAFT_97959, partial [Catenaria anguillulae PL171]
MLNHFLPCIRGFGSPRSTSTATQMEIHHKDNAKAPSKHTNRHGAIETDTLRRLLIQNALVDHFVFLALLHAVLPRFYTIPSLKRLVHAIEAARPFIPSARPRPPFAPAAESTDNHPVNTPLGRLAYSWSLSTPIAAFRHKKNVPLHQLEAFHPNLGGLQDALAEFLLRGKRCRHSHPDRLTLDFSAFDKACTLEKVKNRANSSIWSASANWSKRTYARRLLPTLPLAMTRCQEIFVWSGCRITTLPSFGRSSLSRSVSTTTQPIRWSPFGSWLVVQEGPD